MNAQEAREAALKSNERMLEQEFELILEDIYTRIRMGMFKKAYDHRLSDLNISKLKNLGYKVEVVKINPILCFILGEPKETTIISW